MTFEWRRFLDTHRIAYATGGPNVSRGNVAIHCPFCGAGDQSQHMSVSLEGRGWRCFRQLDHRGKSPVKLVRALLGCSYEQASAIVGSSVFIPDDFAARVNAALKPPIVDKRTRALPLPPEFMLFRRRPLGRLFDDYLCARGFPRDAIPGIGFEYGLFYCTRGPYKGRIIFPVWHDGVLITWTGRTVYPSEQIRYKTLSADPYSTLRDDADYTALGRITDYLLWFDRLMRSKADTIYLCEGPFDALKVNVLGASYGICATCFFTAVPSAAQIDLLHELLPRFERRVLLLDQETTANAVRVIGQLSSLDVSVGRLPPEVKDPGDLTQLQLLKINVDCGSEAH